jgi:hypothetical protein
MILTTRVIKLAAVILLAMLIIGCSGGGGNPVIPGDNSPPPTDEPNPPADDPGPPAERTLWGMWDINFDQDNMTVTMEPVSGVTSMFEDGIDPGIISASLNSVNADVKEYHPSTRVLELDVKLHNPHNQGAYDVRGVVYNDDAGNELRNPEGWTHKFDIPEGTDLNPFKGFAKGQQDRQLLPSTEDTERYVIKLPVTSPDAPIHFAVESSWADNGSEPYYAIENFRHSALYTDGSPWTEVFVDIHDWEGAIDKVTLNAFPITGETETPMEPISVNTWCAKICNDMNASEGFYEVKVTASCIAQPGLQLYQYDNIKVDTTHGWARTWGGESGGDADMHNFGDRARGIEVDDYGNIYVTGMFCATADFDPGEGVDEHKSNGEFDIFLSKFGSGGSHLWTNTFGGAFSEFGDSVAVDSAGNVYVTGRYIGVIDFDPGPGYDYHTAEGKDIFLCKFNSRGAFQWANTWGGPGADYGFGITVDGGDNVFVVGNFDSVADFDPGPGEDIHVGNNGDAYIVKFDTNGGLEWAHTWGGNMWDYCEDVAISPSGYIFITGCFWDSVDFKPGSGSKWRHSQGYWDAFLVKYKPSGTFYWVKTWGGTGYDFGNGLAISSTGDVYVTGDFQRSVDFDPGWGQAVIVVGFHMSTYLSKFSHGGSFQWVQNLSGADVEIVEYSDPGIGIDVDSYGNVYITGWYEGVAEFPEPFGQKLPSNGGPDAYIAKFQYDGDCEWAYNFGGTGRDEGFGLAIDPWNNIYVSGFFWDTVDFEPGPGVTECTSNGKDDVFLVKYKPGGVW